MVPTNKTQCYIVMGEDGFNPVTRWWEPGEDMLFDDNVYHHVHNLAPERRVILLIDVNRVYDSVWINMLNWAALKFVAFNPEITDYVERQEHFHKTGQLDLAPPI